MRNNLVWTIIYIVSVPIGVLIGLLFTNSLDAARLANNNAAQQWVATCTAKHTPERCLAMRELGIAP